MRAFFTMKLWGTRFVSGKMGQCFLSMGRYGRSKKYRVVFLNFSLLHFCLGNISSCPKTLFRK